MMNKEEIYKELKKSRRQNKNDRYEYICKYFNPVNYAMTLEKYSINLHRKNIDLQQRIDKAIFYMENYISVEEYNEPVKCEFKVIIRKLKGEKE